MVLELRQVKIFLDEELTERTVRQLTVEEIALYYLKLTASAKSNRVVRVYV